MSFKVSNFFLIPIISLKRVRKSMLAYKKNSDKKILKITVMSLVVVNYAG